MTDLDRLWVLVAAALVYFMQAGFLCFEVGCVRPKSVRVVTMKNGMDWVVSALAFALVGFGLMFGADVGGLVGTTFFGLRDLASGDDWVFFLFQLGFAVTAVTIVSGALAERASFASYLAASFFVALIVYPVFGHWAWGSAWVEGNQAWLADLGFMDFAGSTVVHSVGAWVALVGAWFVGPRLGRFRPDGEPESFAPSSIPMAALGALILTLGWWGFNGGSTLAFDGSVGSIITNTLLAGSAGSGVALLHCWFLQRKQGLDLKILGGLLSGLVAITAGCNVVEPLAAVAIGGIAGVLHNVSAEFILRRLRIDDPVGAVAVHGVAGAWGTFAVALFGDAALLAHPRGMQALVQLAGIGACFVWSGATALAVFGLVQATFGLRVAPEQELAGIDTSGELVLASCDEPPMDEDTLRELLAG